MGNSVEAFGLVVLVLFGSIAIPVVVSSADNTQIETESIGEGNTVELGTNLEIRANSVSEPEADISVVYTDTGETDTNTLNESDPALDSIDYVVDGSNVTVSLDRIDSAGNAVVTVEYPGSFGYSTGIITIRDNLAIILVTMLFISVMAFVGVRT